MAKCPNCGVESDGNFCPNCATQLKKETICPNCEAEIDAGSIFCSECGEKIEVDNEKTEEKTSEKKEKQENTNKKEEEKPQNQKYCPHCNEALDH